MYRINENGLKLLSEHDNYEALHRAIKLVNKQYKDGLKNKTNGEHVGDDDGEIKTPTSIIDDIQSQVDVYNEQIQINLLNQIMSKEPIFFEQLVIDLLSKMGYKGEYGDAIRTQLSNDNGIDGIINQDPLGTNTVYVQAKRYKADNHIQSPAILGFKGALENKHASKGVFITTSQFSSGALENAERLGIVTVDGKELTQLMLDYHVGVQTKGNMELFGIDTDYFN